MNFYYEGILRMDWGFGNPNRTAALIATLMIASWGLAYFKRWGFWAASIIFTGLGLALVQTFSRGGIVAAAVGCLILLIFAPRPWKRHQVITALVIACIIGGYSFFASAADRYVESWQGDASVLNRLELWKSVPKMITDAPTGWGIGLSQNAFLQWYQGIDRQERFLNLVSLHFTLLAELGWPLRLGYIGLWVFGLILAFPGTRHRELSIPFAILVTFFVAGIFTHFADSWPVYLPPVAALLIALFLRLRHQNWPSVPLLGSGIALTLVTAAIIFLWGVNTPGPAIRGDRHQVVAGQGEPAAWIVIDPTVLGREFGQTFRRFLADTHDAPTLAFVTTVKATPPGAPLVLCGKTGLDAPTLLQNLHCPQLVLLNSALFPLQLDEESQGNVKAFFGEFSHSDTQQIWLSTQKSEIVSGAGDYLPQWPSLLAEALRHP